MTFDAVALCRAEPEPAAILGALVAAGRDLRVDTVDSAGLIQLFDPATGRLLLTVEATRLVQVPGEAQRLLGVPVDGPIWWVESRAPGNDSRAAAVARRFTDELVAITGGETWTGR